MARYHGKDGKIVIGGTDKVNEASGWTLDLSRSHSDASAIGNDFTNGLPGQYSGDVEVTCSYEPADLDGQEAMVTAFLANTTVAATLYELPSATGVKYWSGNYFVTKIGEKVNVGGKVERNFSLKLEGAISRLTA